MSRITIRPSIPADLAQFAWRNAYRMRAWTALRNDRVIGIGGVQFMENSTLVAFVDLSEEARCSPFALHRAARRFLRELERTGVKRVVASADPAQPAAERWLVRLGFKPTLVAGTVVFVWQV